MNNKRIKANDNKILDVTPSKEIFVVPQANNKRSRTMDDNDMIFYIFQ